MVRFLSIYGLVAVFLRAATLVFSALVVGGIVYRVAVLGHNRNLQVRGPCNRLLTIACVALLVTQCVLLTVDSAVSMGTTNLSLRDAHGSNFAVAALTTMLDCVAVLVPVPKTDFLLDGVTRVAVKTTLNTLSTCTMVRLGRVMGNYMIWVVPSNLKLIDRSTIFIMLTSEAVQTKVIGAAELTPTDYVLKPFTVDALMQRIGRAVERRAVFMPAYQLIAQGQLRGW